MWFNNDDGLIPESDSLIDRASGIVGHPDWNSECDIRSIPISRTGGKNYDFGAYDQ